MAKKATTSRSSTGGQFVSASKKSRSSKVKFGSVTVSGTKPSAAAVKDNVARSTEALERFSRKLAAPGIALREKKDVPLFSVAEGETGIFVRRLNGKTQRGRFVNGTFRVIE